MVRSTSLEAYLEVLPKLGNKQKTVFKAILVLAPCTDLMIASYLQVPINEVTPRRGELVKKKAIVENGSKAQNGRRALLWSPATMQTELF